MKELTDLVRYLENRGFNLTATDKKMIDLSMRCAFVLGQRDGIREAKRDLKESLESVVCGG